MHKLKSLQELDLSANAISRLPVTFALPGLKKLILVDNRLKVVPTCLFGMKALQEVDLSLNEITSLPQGIAVLGRIKSFHFDSNPMLLPTMAQYEGLAEFPPVPSLKVLPCSCTLYTALTERVHRTPH